MAREARREIFTFLIIFMIMTSSLEYRERARTHVDSGRARLQVQYTR